jgi:RNA polymerase sigma factor (TIGR02999 family)
MNELTEILAAVEKGDATAAQELLPLVYTELRRLAAQGMANEKPGQTLDATALVHEAYVRLVDGEQSPHWEGRRHFFGAAAEAMRRVLIERARSKRSEKHGGGMRRVDFNNLHVADESRPEELLMLDEALGELERHDPQIAALVKLRFFAGLSHQDSAAALGITRRAADRLWTLARAWLYQRMTRE